MSETIVEMKARVEREKRWLNDHDDEGNLKGSSMTQVDTRSNIEVGEYRPAQKPWESRGHFLNAVASAGSPGGNHDPRLYRATGLSEGIPSSGGFLVDTDFSNEMLGHIWKKSPILPLCKTYNISSGANGIKIPGFDETSRATGSRYGGVRGYWKGEAAQKTASTPKFRQIELNLNKLIGLCYTSDELRQDVSSLDKHITEAFVGEFDWLLTEAVMNGTGAGQPLGINSAGCVVTASSESGQASDTIVTENIWAMWERFLIQDRSKCCWLVNRNCLPQLYSLSLSVGTGGLPVFMPANGMSGKPYNSLMGFPIYEMEQSATVGDLGDIMLVDMSGYVLARKAGMQKDVSIHVQFIYDESVNAADDYDQLKMAA